MLKRCTWPGLAGPLLFCCSALSVSFWPCLLINYTPIIHDSAGELWPPYECRLFVRCIVHISSNRSNVAVVSKGGFFSTVLASDAVVVLLSEYQPVEKCRP